MNLINELTKAIRATLVLWVLVAVIYPTVVLGLGQIAFPHQANGSLLKNAQGQVVGSALIGQPFTSERYFNSRPSTTNYSSVNPQDDTSSILKTGVSGASNLAPSNPALLERIKSSQLISPSNGQPPADLLYTSGSSLDPHITLETARAQIERVASARSLQPNQLEALITQNTDSRFLGIFGEPGVNVLKLNLALDVLKG
jgi:potassium-transporting ATPase KdpC subunit